VRVVPLASFGLQDPFLWLVRRRDHQELEEIGDSLTLPGATLSWPPCLWRFYQCRRLRRTVHRRSTLGTEARRLGNRALLLGLVQITLLLFIWVITLSLWDAGRHWRAHARAADETNLVGWQGSEKWLQGYSESSVVRPSLYFLFFGREEALRELQDLRNRRDAVLWKAVEGLAPNRVAQSAPAMTYLDHFATIGRRGQHQDEAELILREAPHEQKWQTVQMGAPGQQLQMLQNLLQEKEFNRSRFAAQAEQQLHRLQLKVDVSNNEEEWLKTKSRLDRIQGEGSAIGKAEVDKVIEDAEKLPPHLYAETEDQRKYRLSLLEEARRKKAGFAKSEEEKARIDLYQKTRTKFDGAMSQRKVAEAARVLLAAPSHPDTEQLKTQFPAQVLAALQAGIQRDLDVHQFDTARKLVSDLVTNVDVRAFLSKHDLDACKGWNKTIDEAKDRYMYQEACRSQTMENAQDYLDRAPLKSMKEIIEALLLHLNREKGTVLESVPN
jgi:hypothetical protein